MAERTPPAAPEREKTETPAAVQPLEHYPHPRPGRGPEAYLSVAIGILLLLLYPNFVKWINAMIHGRPFSIVYDTTTGNDVPYPQTTFYFASDTMIATFAIVLILDGLALFSRNRLLIALTMLLTAVSTIGNLILCFKFYDTPYGLPTVSAVAVIFGGYLCTSQFSQIRKRA